MSDGNQVIKYKPKDETSLQKWRDELTESIWFN